MRFEVAILRYWKSENRGLDECEDFASANADAGLFAIADGVGTMPCSGPWAKCLADHFLTDPLTSTDGFEVERWVQAARVAFRQALPPETLAQPVRNDLKYQGSAATFCGIRFRHLDFSDESRSQLSSTCVAIALGDSCAIHYSGDGNIVASHPNQLAQDFEALPICFPTIGYGARWWKAVKEREFEFCEGDYFVLATDAVSKWLLVDDQSLRHQRFSSLVNQSDELWPSLVEEQRRARCIPDDDSTAIVIRVLEIDKPLCGATKLEEIIRKAREQRLRRALESDDPINVALEYGTGEHFQEGITQGQKVVEARRTLFEALNRFMLRGKRNRDELQQIWDRYRDVLEVAPWAKGARSTMISEGFSVEAQPSAEPADDTPLADTAETTMVVLQEEEPAPIGPLYQLSESQVDAPTSESEPTQTESSACHRASEPIVDSADPNDHPVDEATKPRPFFVRFANFLRKCLRFLTDGLIDQIRGG